jgi:transcriptional regulator with XRE-family HTH domain
MPFMEKSIHTPEQKKLQRLLRQVRRGAGLRQEDLAKLLGKGQSFVSKYESGERRLDLLEVRRICQAVGISLTDFVQRLEKSLP